MEARKLSTRMPIVSKRQTSGRDEWRGNGRNSTELSGNSRRDVLSDSSSDDSVTARLRRAMPMTFAKKPKAREKNNSTSSMTEGSSDEEGTGKNNVDSSKPSDLVATTSTKALTNSEKKRKLRRSDSIDRDYTVSENVGKSSRLAAQDVSVGILSDGANVVEKNFRMTYGDLRSCKSKRGSKSSSSMELRSSKVRQKSGVALHRLQNIAEDFPMSQDHSRKVRKKSGVALHRLQNIAEDFTMSLQDDSRENSNDEISKQQTLLQKESLYSFLIDMKTSLTKVLGDIEQALKSHFPNNEPMEPVDVRNNSDKNSEVAFSDVETEDSNAPLDLVEAFVEERDAASGTEDAAVAEADSTSVEKSAEESASSDAESDATVLNLSPPRKKSGEETSKNREAIRSEKRGDASSGVESDATVLNLSPRRKKSGEEKSKNRKKIGGEERREKSSNVKSASTVLCRSPRRKRSGEEKSKNRVNLRGEKRRYSSSDGESVATMLYPSPPRKTSAEERSKNREKIRVAQRRDSSSDVESVATVLRFDPLRKKSDQPADQSCSSHDTVINDYDSGGSFDLSDADVAQAREAILMPNREESSAEHRSRTRSSDPEESNDSPLISSESDSRSERSSKSSERYLMEEESENSGKPRKKRSKFRLKKNRFYIADKKMKMNCEVRLVRLRDSVLERYSRGPRKSRKYVESEEIQRHVALDNKKAASSSSEDEDSSKLLMRNKKKTRTKESNETLMNHLKKVNNGKNIVEISESDDETLEEQPDSDVKNEESMKNTKKVVMKEKLSGSLEGEEQKKKKAEKTEKGRWRKSKILTLRISSSDSDEERQKFDTLQDKLANKKKDQGSDSDVEEEESSAKKNKRARRCLSYSS